MATQYDPIAKDESLNTTELTPRNIADVLAEELARIVTALGGGSLEDLNDVAIVTPSNGQTLKYNSTTQKWENANDAGGHTIYNADEQAMHQRAGLGFTDAHVSDNSGDDRTDISIVEGISKTDWDDLDPTDPSNNGLYEITEPNNTPILDDTQIAHGNSTVNAAINAIKTSGVEVVNFQVEDETITIPNCGIGSLIFARNTASSQNACIRFVNLPNDTTLILGTISNFTVSISDYTLSLTAPVNNLVTGVVLRSSIFS